MMLHDPTPAAWWWSREREAGRLFHAPCGLWTVRCWHCGHGSIPNSWAGMHASRGAAMRAFLRSAPGGPPETPPVPKNA
jgi:hypothetical protein